jgi:hypothetical protein
LIRDFGTGANMVIWEGPAPIIGDLQYPAQALRAMDAWLTAIAHDRTRRSVPAKVLADRPATVHDQCSDGNGTVVAGHLCSQAEVPVYGTPRTVAGEPLTTDRSSYDVTFTNAQWATLQKTFPDGVCDYGKPGVDQRPTVPWLTYQTATGRVIYGGRPMPAPPRSHAFG